VDSNHYFLLGQYCLALCRLSSSVVVVCRRRHSSVVVCNTARRASSVTPR